MSKQEERETEALQRDMRLGMGLRATGWTLLAFNGIIVTLVLVGLRIGSSFWLNWLIIEGALGAVLVMAGGRYKAKAGSEIRRLGERNKAA